MNKIYSKAKILSIMEPSGLYEIIFEDGTMEEQSVSNLKFYFPCDNCDNVNDGPSIYGYGKD